MPFCPPSSCGVWVLVAFRRKGTGVRGESWWRLASATSSLRLLQCTEERTVWSSATTSGREGPLQVPGPFRRLSEVAQAAVTSHRCFALFGAETRFLVSFGLPWIVGRACFTHKPSCFGFFTADLIFRRGLSPRCCSIRGGPTAGGFPTTGTPLCRAIQATSTFHHMRARSAALRGSETKVRVLIRPRAGDFCYT